MTGAAGRWQWAWLGGLCLLLLAYAAPLIPLGAEDFRMAGLFSIDEADIATEVQNVYRGGPFRAPSFKYGGAFYYLPQPLLFVLGQLGAVSEHSVIIALRVFCLISGIGCLWLTFRIGAAVLDCTTGLAAALLLLVSPTFLRWSVESHPDLPQLFWILACLYASVRLAEDFRARWVVLAAAFAGAAFGTKYAGGFLLPVVALAVLLSPQGGGPSVADLTRRLLSRRYLLAIVAIPIVFVIAFAVTTPYAVIRFEAFRESLLAEKQIMDFGHTYRADPSGILWIGMLVDAVGRPHILAFAVCVLGGIRSVVRDRRVRADRAVLLAWMVVFLGYLIFEVHLRRTRHLLPVLPCLFLFAANGYRLGIDWLKEKIPRLPPAAVLLPLLLVGLSWSQIAEAVRLFEGKWTRMDGITVDLTAARWMQDRFLPETSILYDAYAYVPGVFPNAYRTFGMAYSTVSHFEPDLLVVRQATAGAYADPENAGEARMGEEAFLDRHYFYTYLSRGLLPDYRLTRDFGPIAVYERTAPRVREDADPTRRWWKLIKNYTQKKAHGMMEAHRTMGDIHASLGRMDLAEQGYARARETTNYTARLYRMARRQLSAGRTKEAERAFGEMAAMMASRSPEERDKIHAEILRDLVGQGVPMEQAKRVLESAFDGGRTP